jgi:hypothetical protein
MAVEQPLVALATFAAVGEPSLRQAIDRASGGTDDMHELVHGRSSSFVSHHSRFTGSFR